MITMRLRGRGVEAAFKRFTPTPARKKQILTAIADNEISQAKHRIVSTKRDPEGRQWAPWAVSTSRQRRREGSASRGLLYRKGRLLNSFRKIITGTGAAVIRNTARYAGYLQFGTRRMPARPYLGFNEQSKRFIRDLIRRTFT